MHSIDWHQLHIKCCIVIVGESDSPTGVFNPCLIAKVHSERGLKSIAQ
jgi:hypothetical protein